MSRLSLDASRRLRPIPYATETSRPYWNGAREGVLRLQRCRTCQRVIHYPRQWCPQCWSNNIEHFNASGNGRVVTHTIVHEAPFEAYDGHVPYVLAVVLLDEGVTMLSNIVGPDAMDVAIDDPVVVRFEKRNDWTAIPQFERVVPPSSSRA